MCAPNSQVRPCQEPLVRGLRVRGLTRSVAELGTTSGEGSPERSRSILSTLASPAIPDRPPARRRSQSDRPCLAQRAAEGGTPVRSPSGGRRSSATTGSAL
jgi:hypothetical protein